MYTREEAKKIRETFWNQFKSWSAGKRSRKGKKGRWIMNDTGIRQLKLKFHFDDQFALAGIEIDTRNLEKRLELWEKMESLKPRLEEKADFTLQWEIEYRITEYRTVSRVYSILPGVNIYDRQSWKQVKAFLYERMTVFEEFFLEYRDYLKY